MLFFLSKISKFLQIHNITPNLSSKKNIFLVYFKFILHLEFFFVLKVKSFLAILAAFILLKDLHFCFNIFLFCLIFFYWFIVI